MPHDRLRAIFFDFDGTLRHSVPLGGDVFNDYVAGLGFSLSAEDRRRAGRWEHRYWANSPTLQNDLQTFGDDEQGFWHHYAYRRLLALGLAPSLAEELASQVWQYMEAHYRPQDRVPEDVWDVLRALHESGYVLAVVSNRKLPYGEDLERLGLAAYFRFAMAAGEVRAWKPAPEIFEHALRRAGVAPSEAVYIGDNYYADVIGARSAGLHAVLYDPRRIFPEPDCAVIRRFGELPEALACLRGEA